MQRSTRILRAFVLSAMLCSAAPTLAVTPRGGTSEGLPRVLDDYIARTLHAWDIPGGAVVVVKEGRVAAFRAYGVRELGRPELVDANTMFDIASITKSFTAAAIASLVDEGRMAWDAPVRQYLPKLSFPDPYLTANVTVRDLLCHRVGVRSTNRAWYLTHVSRARLLELIPRMEIAAPFRTRFTYWNIGYTVAGEATAAVAGIPYEEFVTRRLLEPLGMTRTTAYFDSALSMGNVASGHEVIGGVHRVTPRETTRASTAPAGILQASPADVAKWMLFQLGDGSHGGRRILSADAMSEMHSAQFAASVPPRFRTSRQMRFFPAYGLGWQVFDYRGHLLIWHSGSGDGQLAYVALLPEEQLGIAFMINSAKPGSAFNGAMASRILDHYLSLPTRDYAAEYRVSWIKDVARAADSERALEAARLSGTSPSRPLADCAGEYVDPLGLDVKVSLVADTLRLRYGGGEIATLSHWHHDTWRARWSNPLHAVWPMFVTFELGADGRFDRLQMNPFADDVEARRKAR